MGFAPRPPSVNHFQLLWRSYSRFGQCSATKRNIPRRTTLAKSALNGPQEQEVVYQWCTSGWIERIVELALIWRPDLVDRATREVLPPASGFEPVHLADSSQFAP